MYVLMSGMGLVFDLKFDKSLLYRLLNINIIHYYEYVWLSTRMSLQKTRYY